MITVPLLPLDIKSKELIDFCLKFRTTAGFIARFEQNWEKHGNTSKTMGAAYEETEILYNHFFGERRYKDREVFYNARCRYNSKG